MAWATLIKKDVFLYSLCIIWWGNNCCNMSQYNLLFASWVGTFLFSWSRLTAQSYDCKVSHAVHGPILKDLLNVMFLLRKDSTCVLRLEGEPCSALSKLAGPCQCQISALIMLTVQESICLITGRSATPCLVQTCRTSSTCSVLDNHVDYSSAQ